MRIFAITVTSTFLAVACGSTPDDADAESQAAADTAASESYEQYGMHEYRAQGPDTAADVSPDARNTSKCSAARPPKNATLNKHGGPIIKNAKVYNIGYGGVADGATLNAYTKWLVEGSYVTNLGEYGVGAATFEEGFQGAASTTKTVTDSQIQGFLGNLLAHDKLPRDFSEQSLFMVYTSPGVTVVNNHSNNSRSCTNFCGYHGSFGIHSNVTSRVLTVNYAVIPDTGACPGACWVGSNTPNREKTISHELAEALTDPRGNDWWDSANGQEIGDLCNSAFYTTTHGYTAQCEWSNRHGGCVNNTP